MTDRDDWDRWREEWRSPTAPQASAAVYDAQTRARRALRRARLVETLVVIAAIALLTGAMLHAASPVEAVAAVGVGATIMVAWFRRLAHRRDEVRALVAPTAAYDDLARHLLQRELGLARFVIIVVALMLLFLVPWWLAGAREHVGDRMLTGVTLWTLWLPLAGMCAVLVWAVRLRARARRSLAAQRRVTNSGHAEPPSASPMG